jgi:predicted Zn-dependent protease
VTLAGLGCAVALLILAGREPRPRLHRKARVAGVGAAVLLSLLTLGALAGNQTLAAASASLDADQPARAARDARWAKRLVPWSPEPWRLHGEALLSQGDLDGARRDFQSALRKDSSDWDSWVDLALVTRGGAQRRAVEQAHRLNPLEPIHLGGG